MKSTRILLLIIMLSVLIYPQVAGAGVSFGEEVIVKAGKTVNEAVSIGDDIHVYGTVQEKAVAVGGDVFVESGGHVKGNAVAIGGDIFVRNSGNIDENAVTLGGRTRTDFGGAVHGELVTLFPNNIFFNFGDAGLINNIFKFLILGPVIGIFGIIGVIIALIFSLLKLVLFLAIAALVTHFFPKNVSNMAEFSRKEFWKSLLLGFVVVMAVPFIVIALLITIIGIPIIPPFMVFLFIAYLFGSVGVALWVGCLIPNSEHRSDMQNVVIGVLVIGLVRLIPAVGLLVKFAVLAVAFGVVLFTRFGMQKNTTA